MGLLSTKEAAARLGVSVLRVQQLIWAERLPAQKVGRDYIINEGDLKLVADRKPGRPPKKAAADKARTSGKNGSKRK
jgi:excisionase family DNA binding protein